MTERINVAKELAAKDGQAWGNLTEMMQKAYLHNADLFNSDISEAGLFNDVADKPKYTCPRCQDKAFIDDKRCLECNPVGLPVEQVHPKGPVEEVRVVEDPVIKCPTCGGKGFTEFDHGMLQVECADCGGTGQVKDGNSGTGTERDNQITGSTNPSQPAKPQKPKAKRAARAKAK